MRPKAKEEEQERGWMMIDAKLDTLRSGAEMPVQAVMCPQRALSDDFWIKSGQFQKPENDEEACDHEVVSLHRLPRGSVAN